MKTVEGVVTLIGKQPGKTLTIMGGVHGDEVCGIKALDEIISNISLKQGKVHFVYGNPQAIGICKRQTEMNLNRAFRSDELLSEKEKQSYERQRALEIMPFMDESVALLDVHSSTTKISTPFIICEPHSFEIAKFLPFPIISYGWDLIQAGGTDYYMNHNGKIGICVECGYHLDPDAPRRAIESIMIFLSLFGAIDKRPSEKSVDQKIIHAYQIHLTKTDFTPFREFADFESLEEGEIIGTDGNDYILAPSNACVVFPHRREKPSEEAFVLGKRIFFNK